MKREIQRNIAGNRLTRALGSLAGPLNRFAARRPGIWLAGGAVRDALLGRKVLDADLVVMKGSVLAAAREFVELVKGDLVVLGAKEDSEKLPLVRVLARGAQADFTPPRARPIQADLMGRDFTVNAMAVELPWGGRAAIQDPAGGFKDLKAGILRMCRPDAFARDPVRLWRAHREAAELKLRVEAKTARRLKLDARRAAACTPERLRDELFKLLKGGKAPAALKEAAKSGVLGATFPEIGRMAAVRVRGIPAIRVLEHTLEAMEHLERGLRALKGELAAHMRLELVPGRPRHVLVRLAALLHDLGKPETVSRDEEGNVHFFGHDKLGGKMSAELMRKRLKCAESEISAVGRAVSHHLRLGYLASTGELSDRAVYRFLRDAGEELFELIVLGRADRLATHHYRAVSARRQEAAISRILAVRRAIRGRERRPRLLNGHDILREFDLKPGPIVGKLLRAAEEAQALGRVRTREQALSAARRELDRLGKPV